MTDDVKGLFRDLLDGYVNELLDDPKGCTDSPEELKEEIALAIKAGKMVGLDVAKRFEGMTDDG